MDGMSLYKLCPSVCFYPEASHLSISAARPETIIISDLLITHPEPTAQSSLLTLEHQNHTTRVTPFSNWDSSTCGPQPSSPSPLAAF